MDILTAEDENVAEKADLNMDIKRLYEHIGTALTEREKTIIMLRYGLGGERPATQQQTADKLGISRSYVSRLEKRALTRLMNAWRR